MYDSQYFFPRKFSCPLCMTNFTSLQIKSSTVYVEKRESDFRTVYRGHSPFHYYIIVCPTCEYAKTVSTFNTPLDKEKALILSEALYQLRSPETFSHQEERDLDTALECFQLGIRTAQLLQVPSGELAGIILGTAWIAREMENTKLENYYIEQAVAHYVKAYQQSSQSIGNLSDIQVLYLIGELYRKIGNYSESLTWFSRVLSNPKIRANPQLEQQTRDQWGLAREQAKAEGNEENPDPAKSSNILTEPLPVPKTRRVQPPERKRALMQLTTRLYGDQIEWLGRVANIGHNTKTHQIITKEQVLRALMSAAIKALDKQMPANFKNEEELVSRFYDLLQQEILTDK